MFNLKKEGLKNNLKNFFGSQIKKRILIFSVDDYGNVRVDSRQARDGMKKAGLKTLGRFDAFDTLETREDLEMLFEALTSVKDKNGRHAVFTPFAVPCNIDFERLAVENYQQYHYELLPQTYEKLSGFQPEAYKGTWTLWQEGITKELVVPQFHGREHLNLKFFEEKLAKRDFEVMTALKNRSYTSISEPSYSTISYTAAFDFWDFRETEKFHEIIRDGLACFESVFGYPAVHFNPPGGREHSVIHKTLKENGIKYIDEPLIKKEHQGKGRYKTSFNYTGKRNPLGQIIQVRNVVFEPTHKTNFDWVNQTLEQIEAAFRWNRPAIISSHRVNFCGHIDPKNREKGLSALKDLLKNIVKRWPDVEFMAANELGDLISGVSDDK